MAVSIPAKFPVLLVVLLAFILLQHSSYALAARKSSLKSELEPQICEYYETVNRNYRNIRKERYDRPRYAVAMTLDKTWKNYCRHAILHKAFQTGCRDWLIDYGDDNTSHYPQIRGYTCYDRFYFEPRNQIANLPLPDELPACIFETLQRLEVCFQVTALTQCVCLPKVSLTEKSDWLTPRRTRYRSNVRRHLLLKHVLSLF